ncbi:MAG: porin family protein [Muribaculaceae bacterium]
MKSYRIIRIFLLFAATIIAMATQAQLRDKVLNRPYADLKRWHLGFSVGAAFHDLNITNNGFVSPDGNAWYGEIPSLSPGFAVGVLADLRLSNHFNLRLSPGMQFGSKTIKWRDAMNPDAALSSQNVKSTFVVMPLELKCSALRYHNARPYVIGGVMGVLDVSKRRSEQLQFNTTDAMLTLGFGCDFYMPYFKFCPEVKFCFGLRDILKRDRPDLQDNPTMEYFTQGTGKVTNNMMVITFYFE